jgi:hypothetical protein
MTGLTIKPAWAAVILLGVLYSVVGIVFTMPTGHVRAWRLAAWIVSAAAYAAHFGYERFKLRTSLRAGALHVGLGVALGAFGLAAGANVHSLVVGSSHAQRQLLLLALVSWPLMTFLPAFLAALGADWVMTRFEPPQNRG